jgi:hypothetical protein
MNEKALHLYDLMQTDLSLCQRKGMGRLKEIECCFQIADRYWAILKDDVIRYEFENIEREIQFFKKIKPLFLSEAEYYGLLYHAELFRVETVKEDQLKFWEREALRLEKFRQENENFYACYQRGCTEYDRVWYVRTDEQELSDAPERYDREEKATTSHDLLVASLLALERYHAYVTAQLSRLQNAD